MQKILIFFSLFLISIVGNVAVAADSSTNIVSGSSANLLNNSSNKTLGTNSGSTVKYKGVDERNNLKMFTVAILPFDTKGVTNESIYSEKQLRNRLNQIIIAQITQTRKFRVSNRDAKDEKAYEEEIRRIINSNDSSEKDKLNQRIGADFILTGDILGLNISKKKSSYYGEDFTTLNVSASVAYRMIELATMEVKWSNVVRLQVPANIANEYANYDNGDHSQILDYVAEQIGQTISEQIVGAIYPLQVLKVDDGEIYFNQGGNGVVKGSTYEIRQEGGTSVDPATGQHIVLDSKVLAKVRITDVMPKYSVGIVIDGSLSKIQAGLRAYLSK
ncbi:penicillin-binding protein activator LpoB [Francisella philomiragia]|nr:CsgG/HfaB family protein [Francisella philomiragia]AJI46509.1 curli production assembly/transport component CsgG family protein [Francisella philomiragia]AJI48391.1 curli production assembly/transport component CsgG family protein [Francisella philomiragia]MBK2020692.1 penicillin-binding protein activator LpoB [Francisella philomiragia]MBK2030889.1 penicillin-binding protein activator LpoB [Francisella philomiragia]MBK2263453.1 penicillin-binding protein activator LpoB [Francisella philomir